MNEHPKPALARILAEGDIELAFAALAGQLSGADLTTFLMALFAERVEALGPADLMRQYRRDRFVAPGQIDPINLARIELRALEVALAGEFTPVALAPVAPFGTHKVLGSVPQNNVVSTSRLSEVTADPTNSLALEAAVKRAAAQAHESRSNRAVRLGAVHRVVRAQRFEGPRSFAHFSLLGLVTAGRDQGNYDFERSSIESQIATLIDLVRGLTPGDIRVSLSAFHDSFSPVCASIAEALRTSKQVACELWPEREHGRGYYQNLCFKLYVTIGEEEVELGDGGDVEWTQDLLQSRKERMVIGGLGLDRLAMLVTA